jgi:hypothetical protein
LQDMADKGKATRSEECKMIFRVDFVRISLTRKGAVC